MAIIASEDMDPDTGQKIPKRGGRLNRSETVTVRLDPRLNYLCELAARAQRRTKSSFIEWAVEASLEHVKVVGTRGWGEKEPSIEQLAANLWDVDEPDRLAALAFNAPILMTHEEQVIWKVIKEYGYLWRGQWLQRTSSSDEEEWTWSVEDRYLVPERLRETFDEIKRVAAGDAPVESLPIYDKRRKANSGSGSGWDSAGHPKRGGGFGDDLDEDIPF